MRTAADILTALRIPSLESLFPAGLLDGDASRGAGNALRAIRVLEELLAETSAGKALAARYALFQTFARIEDRDSPVDDESIPGADNFLRAYATALMPEWYSDIADLLSDEELESFLKIYLSGHEYWGHQEGIAILVRGMLTACMHQDAKVIVRSLVGQDRKIPDELWSHLGNHDQYSRLGDDFVLGTRFYARPLSYEIFVGPISMSALKRLQDSGWAQGTRGSSKLQRLIEFAEPFYLRSSVRILLEAGGFIAGRACLGEDRLGMLDAGAEKTFDVLVGAK